MAPVTGTARDIPSEVFLSKQDGMPRDCAVNCDHVQTVSKSKLGSLIATLAAAKISVDLGLPMADSVMLATARAHDATLWTQDADFERLDGVKYRKRKA